MSSFALIDDEDDDDECPEELDIVMDGGEGIRIIAVGTGTGTGTGSPPVVELLMGKYRLEEKCPEEGVK